MSEEERALEDELANKDRRRLFELIRFLILKLYPFVIIKISIVYSLKIKNHLKICAELPVFFTFGQDHLFFEGLEERMLKYLPGVQSFLRIYLYQFGQQILTILRKMYGQSKGRKIIFLRLLNKGRLNHQHLIHQHSNTPAIYFIIIIISLSNLRTYVVQSSAKSSSLLISLRRPTKICNLQMIAKANDILWLQISMHDTIPMEIFDSTSNLEQKFGSFFLIKRSSPQNLFVKIVISILHYKKNLLLSNVVPVCRQDMRMLAVQMDFHLLNEKLHLHLLLFKAFQRHNNIIYIRNSKDDFSCLALPQSFQHLQFVFWLFRIFQLCNFFQCFIHVLQFIIYVYLFLKILSIQLYRCFVVSQFTTNIIHISHAINITMISILMCHSASMTLIKCR